MSLLVLSIKKNKESVTIKTPCGREMKIFMPAKTSTNRNEVRLGFKCADEDKEFFDVNRVQETYSKE